MSGNVNTPLLQDRSGNVLPFGSAQVQDHPIFLRVCHSPWSWLSQGTLVYLRAGIVAYLTAVGGMLIDYKINHRGDDAHTSWRILFQFSSLAFVLLWLYHFIAFCWGFTHLYYPDVEEDDQSWESRVLLKMSPPVQTARSRKRFYFSLFYTIVHVVVFMNALIFWTVLVPQDHGHLPKGHEAESYSDVGDFFSDGWFEPFCVLNLWVFTTFLASAEILVLNSVKRQVPVPSHVFAIIFFLSCYIGWAAFGKIVTDHYPFFWMDPEAMGKKEIVAAYASGFVGLGPTVFAFMYGLIGMRENLTKKDDSSSQFKQSPVQSRQANIDEDFQRGNAQV
ncbi:hypothetical protein B0H63DRAFT_463150 [Podospora didyma]|uniref:Uncharacterized protein n=1 Tax=Podospora didyma TaxID=330526 RepID=A0AAE0NX33_9PEZI|nr:hypothetical protein B0H63DRAFT_463150 [Podospora didyma]